MNKTEKQDHIEATQKAATHPPDVIVTTQPEVVNVVEEVKPTKKSKKIDGE